MAGVGAMVMVMVMVMVAALAGVTGAVVVPAGIHTPFYPAPDQDTVAVAAFAMDPSPVTNDDFLRFVSAHPEWRRDQIKRLFADDSYLSWWPGPLDLGQLSPRAPVTQVSWHAARAYCHAAGGQLPTVSQWEYAADATTTAPHGARRDPDTLALVLAWYASRDEHPHDVAQLPPNLYGLTDLHGLIWEWTDDFNSVLIASDPRESGDQDILRFCGAGAISAIDPADYASFMRFAYRSSLKADFTTQDLGFRCAYTLP